MKLQPMRVLVFEGYGNPRLSRFAASSEYRPLLKLGMSGPAVAEARQALDDAGYPSAGTTNVFGPIMMSAVQRFQRDSRLTADGVIGARTWSALLGHPITTTRVSGGSSTPSVDVEIGPVSITQRVSEDGTVTTEGGPNFGKIALFGALIGLGFFFKRQLFG